MFILEEAQFWYKAVLHNGYSSCTLSRIALKHNVESKLQSGKVAEISLLKKSVCMFGRARNKVHRGLQGGKSVSRSVPNPQIGAVLTRHPCALSLLLEICGESWAG